MKFKQPGVSESRGALLLKEREDLIRPLEEKDAGYRHLQKLADRHVATANKKTKLNLILRVRA